MPGYTVLMHARARTVVALLAAALLLQEPDLVGQTAAARYADRAQLMRDVTTLASPPFEGRRSGSPGGIRAREWIVAQFRAIGLSPAGTDGYLQAFSGGAANVIGRIEGRDPALRTLVITAHYDHEGIKNGVLYPGADDNASGVAGLLAAARHFKSEPPRHTIVFAALDDEESSLRGARIFVATGLVPVPRMAVNVNLDMLSRSDDGEIYAVGTYHSPRLRPMLEQVQRRASVRLQFGHDRPSPGRGGLDDWTQSSDHAIFHNAGVPFIYFGVEDHADYHKPTDTADKIDPDFFGGVVDMVIDAIRTFDTSLS